MTALRVVPELDAGAGDVARDRVLLLPEHVQRLDVAAAVLQQPVEQIGVMEENAALRVVLCPFSSARMGPSS